MTRWTVRNVEPEAIFAVQRIAIENGVGLGEALSAAIRHGTGGAIEELEHRNSDFDLVEALQHIEELQHSIAQGLRRLSDSLEGRSISMPTEEVFMHIGDRSRGPPPSDPDKAEF